ncbi:methionyl-tRNA formyltransferase [Enterocloster sp.]|uniref:methionyl-tRNA formyltransferase n=1 Tax=Enterocloster sp. TaxID=2719315 RepID=UPI00399F31DE
MRIVFMGTPDFSVPALKALVEAGHEVAAVVTQPDRPRGRGKELQMTPVKVQALAYGIPVYQPEKVKDPAFVEILRNLQPEVIVVIAFGQILSRDILDLPPYGCINIHASLLPKYRGAAPIQWAVIDGEKETGVTTMMMDVGLDTGDMLEKTIIPLDPKETGGSLFDKLSQAGGPLILSTLEKLKAGTAVRTPQTDEDSTYAKMLTKSLGQIDWSMEAAAIERLIRGLNPWPSAYTFVHGKTLKIWDADVLKESSDGAAPGQIIRTDPHSLIVAAGEALLSIRELQLEGKKRMEVETFLRGYTIEKGEILGK